MPGLPWHLTTLCCINLYRKHARNLLSDGVEVAYTVSYTTTTSVSGDDDTVLSTTASDLFDDITDEISAAVNDGTLETELTSNSDLSDAAVDASEYSSPVRSRATSTCSPCTTV